MGKIQVLEEGLIDQIAAGEVVERPASLIKELVENSLDAGAKRVEIEIEGGGTRLVRITDDGEGISEEELPLAVHRHATSKLRSTEDLFAIQTFGFRGEALASIAAVSHLRLASRTREASMGAELRVDGGKIGPVRPAGIPPGTTIEVGDLFFNIPARRAFLKTERGEFQAILGEVRKAALGRHDVLFRVTHEGKTSLEAPAEDEPRARIAQLLGRELSEGLIALPTTHDEVGTIRGYITPCDRTRGDTTRQYFFLNGRPVRDKTLLAAVKSAYSNLIPPRRHPSLLIWLDLAPGDVDVNVHPQKSEVRFRQDRSVFHRVARAIKAALHEHGLVAEIRLPGHRFSAPTLAPGANPPPPPRPASTLLPFPQRPLTPGGFPPSGGGGEPAGQPAALPGEQFSGARATGDAPVVYAPQPQEGSNLGVFLQVHRRYVVEETEGGVRIVDPHALHERILYEQILERLKEGELDSQRFLFPQIVELGTVEVEAFEQHQDVLTRLGFEVTGFGGNALAVHAAPRMLTAERVEESLRTMLRGPQSRGADEEETGLLHDLAASLACRSAVRFGDAVPPAQLEALLAQRTVVRRGHCCPHGRPTALSLSLDELDRRFGRQGFS